MRSNKTLRTILILLVVGVIGFFVYKALAGKEEKKLIQPNAGANQKKKEILVDAHVVKTSVLDEAINASGTLQSNEEVELKPEISGRITHIYFKEGANVAKGALLVKIYDEDIKAQLQKLKLQQELAKTTLKRQESLLKINGISQQDVDVTANQVSAYGADIEYNQAQLQKTEIRAPFSGTIGLRNVSEGAIVSPTTIMTTLQQLNPLKIDFTVPEKYRNAVKVGDEISFSVAGDNNTYKGKIYAIDPKIDLATRSLKLRALLPNPGNKLLPGAFAKTTISLKDIPNAIMIPSQCVIPGTRDKKVIISENGLAKSVIVETGVRDENNIQILMGLEPGDTVITTGILQLRDGMNMKFKSIE
ncbi:efflux transporter periplasmic adaptor subunit [Chitinophaga caeni]|uniref:Efflux transporter periplasmic adaptor subunit n=1 Tax=Chitinophaga caeni TaxID=2029983 RepID=A0A291QSJ6_9BACT|nr:efflux RND transporter periplasmic adaptor subunit [Chitinophaga caeni]ATL46948.1 efflux transporter periplasmic adaptor subunit [Chitinophaga caeni]